MENADSTRYHGLDKTITTRNSSLSSGWAHSDSSTRKDFHLWGRLEDVCCKDSETDVCVGDGSRIYNDLYIFDTMANAFLRSSLTGACPAARCAHTATLLDDSSLLVFGGGKNFNVIVCMNPTYCFKGMEFGVLKTFICWTRTMFFRYSKPHPSLLWDLLRIEDSQFLRLGMWILVKKSPMVPIMPATVLTLFRNHTVACLSWHEKIY